MSENILEYIFTYVYKVLDKSDVKQKKLTCEVAAILIFKMATTEGHNFLDCR